jgi:hypothetical protein
MFKNEELQRHLESSNSIESENVVVAEWNMNVPGNIDKLGNYRYRQNDTRFSALPNFYDPADSANSYSGATDSDVSVEYGLEEDESTPLLFTYPKDKEKLYYSLEECIKPIRPRSGINKLSYFTTNSIPSLSQSSYSSTFVRPRYYMSTREDEFKYWRSYRIESNLTIQVPSTVSRFATLSLINRIDKNTTTATMSNLESISELPVGKIFSAKTVLPITFSGTRNVESPVFDPEEETWTATLTGFTSGSTSDLRVGDAIAADPGTGALAGTGAKEILIASISSTSITYSFIGGIASGPTVGNVTLLRTVSGDITPNEARVSEIIDSTSVIVTISGTTDPKPGTISDVYINKYNTNQEYGISKNSFNGVYDIEDCNPFVVYKKEVPANRLVVKVQTNVGDEDLGPFRDSAGTPIPDPFFGESNKTTPKKFSIQYLTSENIWVDAFLFDENSTRPNGDSIFGPDGHLELEYGIKVPDLYENSFTFLGTLKSTALLPDKSFFGASYLITKNNSERGMLYVYNGDTYDEYTPEYIWSIKTDGDYGRGKVARQLVNPIPFQNPSDARDVYREFVWVKGIRVAVKTMNRPDVPLELIEISPRLVVDLSQLVISLDVKKSLSDLSSSALPVGSLVAGTGSLELFDPEQTFNTNNSWDKQTKKGSIVAEYYDKRIKFIFYEVIKRVNNNSYYIPLKTLYTDGFPERNAQEYTISLSLRDLYFHFESIKAPRLLITDVSLSQAIAILLDATGFSNYVFKRAPGVSDPVIPYFFVPPDQNVAEVLAQLAVSTQSAMFFDEYNNFVVMTKEYLLGDRDVDFELLGETTNIDNKTKLPNIISIASQNKEIYNAGEISYTNRYIKKGARRLSQARFVDRDYVYSPSILWEASGTEAVRSQNTQQQSAFALSAVPINTELTDAVPIVRGGVLINNEIDVGENSYWLSRFQGFLYANGEIIKYDAVEYTITGPPVVDNNGRSLGNTVWISSNKEYQKYFAKMPFNGKIYPTGLVRIYAEPFYETINDQTFLKNGEVVRHGRGQFGTPIVNHPAGLSSYWSDSNNVRGCVMDSNLLYTTKLSTEREIPPTKLGPAGVDNQKANSSSRNGIIRNFMSSKYYSESELKSLKTTEAGTTQSSAFVVTGPDFDQTATPQDFVTYIHKPMNGAFKHLGTRVRIIGKVESSSDKSQTVVGGMTYFNITGDDATKNVSIGGGSAGINLVNPDTNNGYYFELAALTSSDASNFLKKNDDGDATVSIENILFYKIEKNNNSGILFQGNPVSVFIKSKDSSTSITYTVLGGGVPIAGAVGNPRTIPDPEIIIGSGTVASISKVTGRNAWDAKLTGVVSVIGLRVGDVITATNESGALFGGAPTSVKITAIDNNLKEISYRVTGGKTPTAGTVTDAKTVPGKAIRFGDKNPKFGKIGKIKEEAVTDVPGVTKLWNVKLTGLNKKEVEKLRVGDRITATAGEQDKAVPTRLWGGIGSVIVDDGNFAGQGRYLAEENPTVYDLAMEYVDVSPTRRDFYLYINQKLVQKVTDTKPITISNPSMGLFVRGTSKAMFENVYALSKNYATNTVFDTNVPIAPVFGDRDSLVNASEALSKYAISGAIQETYLSHINPGTVPDYNLYYEEFGTIVRECAYFNIKYDRAYPAFYARIAPTFNRTRGYTVSGFTADSYGAEFLVFNNTDTVLTLDDKSSNYLRIQGIAFTQDTTNTITVDDYLKQKGDLSDPEFRQDGSVESPDRFVEAYEKIRLSRIQYGKNEFSLSSTYIQDAETAEDILGWIIDKNIRPRKLVGLNIFSNPTLQLGDVVSVKYDNNEGIGLIDSNSPKYVVYNIEYNKSVDGPDMSVYLSEV